MARKLKLEIGGLNIRLHPHTPDRYRDFFRSLFRLKQVVVIRGDRSGLLTSLRRIGGDDRFINGVITTFLDFDMDEPWFNTDTMEVASTNELESINIPENLRPSSRSFYFRFDVEGHELVFEHYAGGNRLTHQSALTFFRGLAEHPSIVREFGDVKISIIQSQGSIDRLFSIPRITEIEIYIEKPNSDLWGAGFEGQAEEHLDDKNARSMTVSYKAERGNGITRDEDLDALIRTSLRNGRTVASGYGANGHETVTTDRYPKVVQDKYDEEEISNSQKFQQLADLFKRRR
jgi:hypothetical protein